MHGMKHLLILLLLAAPLNAIAPVLAVGESCQVPITETSVQLVITELKGRSVLGATVTTTLALKGLPEATTLLVELPSPPSEEATNVSAWLGDAELPAGTRVENALRWNIMLPAGITTSFTWVRKLIVNPTYGEDILGGFAVRVPLRHITGWAAMPKAATVTISHTGLPAALFGRDNDESFVIEHPCNKLFRDYQLGFNANTAAELRDSLSARISSTLPADAVHTNAAYTRLLVDLADVLRLTGESDLLLETLAKLATLESTASAAITHCGPWAGWRKYVPWSLQQLELLESLGRTEAAAALATKLVAELDARFAAQAVAATKPRPHENFDEARFGRYYDYDWKRARTLFTRAQELAKGNK